MSWQGVVSILIVTAGIFFMSWQAPVVTLLVLGSAAWWLKRLLEDDDQAVQAALDAADFMASGAEGMGGALGKAALAYRNARARTR